MNQTKRWEEPRISSLDSLPEADQRRMLTDLRDEVRLQIASEKVGSPSRRKLEAAATKIDERLAGLG